MLDQERRQGSEAVAPWVQFFTFVSMRLDLRRWERVKRRERTFQIEKGFVRFTITPFS